MRYVVGFMFDPEYKKVVLIYKTTGPERVLNKWNGVGGKIENGESEAAAMVREFQEEAGVKTEEHDWMFLNSLSIGNDHISFLYTALEEIDEVKTRTHEQIAVFPFHFCEPTLGGIDMDVNSKAMFNDAVRYETL